MGTGIAQVCAQSGYDVHLMDINAQALRNALREMEASLKRLYAKDLLAEIPAAILERIRPEQSLECAAQVEGVIESVLEIEDLKKEIFRELGRLAPRDIFLATNTSSIPVTRLANETRFPERVLGLHFFGPVPLMGLVEVIKGEKTAESIFAKGVDFVKSIGKTPVRVRRDIPCFVMNRIFSAAFREAVDLVAQGVVTPEEVDAGMKLGYGWTAGPFEIADNAGLDTVALIGRSMKQLGEDDLCPRSDLIDRMVREGRTGRKAGRGFYRYTAEGKRIPADQPGQPEIRNPNIEIRDKSE